MGAYVTADQLKAYEQAYGHIPTMKLEYYRRQKGDLYPSHLLEQMVQPSPTDKQTHAFLELPGETRNTIYRYAFLRRKPINGILTKIPAIWLLATCKQVHQEASSILYGENIFTFGVEINWRDRVEIMLYGFPSLPIWPAPRYHPFLKALKIEISFTGGHPTDMVPPEIQQKQIQAMRDAFDSVWDDIDVSYSFKQGNLDKLTFTMAWIKFRMLEPIAHPNCKIKTKGHIHPLVKWALEATLRPDELRSSLCIEQEEALTDAANIARDAYDDRPYNRTTELAKRLAWNSPLTGTGGSNPNNPLSNLNSVPSHFSVPLPNPNSTLFNNFGAAPAGPINVPPLALNFFGHFPTPAPLPRRGQPLYNSWTFSEDLEHKLTQSKALDLLMKDNEMRVLAALAMPDQTEKLTIKGCCELRCYFALQEAAMKLTALNRSFEAALEKERDNAKENVKRKGKERVR